MSKSRKTKALKIAVPAVAAAAVVAPAVVSAGVTIGGRPAEVGDVVESGTYTLEVKGNCDSYVDNDLEMSCGAFKTLTSGTYTWKKIYAGTASVNNSGVAPQYTYEYSSKYDAIKEVLDNLDNYRAAYYTGDGSGASVTTTVYQPKNITLTGSSNNETLTFYPSTKAEGYATALWTDTPGAGNGVALKTTSISVEGAFDVIFGTYVLHYNPTDKKFSVSTASGTAIGSSVAVSNLNNLTFSCTENYIRIDQNGKAIYQEAVSKQSFTAFKYGFRVPERTFSYATDSSLKGEGTTIESINPFATFTGISRKQDTAEDISFPTAPSITSATAASATVNRGTAEVITVKVKELDKGDTVHIMRSLDGGAYTEVKNAKSDGSTEISYADSIATTSLSAGSHTVRYQVYDSTQKESSVVTVNFTVAVPLQTLTINKTTLALTKGGSETLSVTKSPTDATNAGTVTWNTSNASVATVNSSGVVTAVGKGTADITATCGGKTVKCTVTVTVPTTGININKPTASITKGGTETLTATVLPSDASNATVTWSSSNPSVASVTNGVVKGLASGEATITATCGTFSASCKVTVTNPLKSITLSKTATSIVAGGTETLTATLNPTDADNKTITWTSSDTSVATVSGGKITALKAGSTTITASCSGKSASCTVTVTAKPVESVTLSKTTVSLVEGGSETITASVNPAGASDQTVAWSSDNTNVATVSGGKITALKPGTAKITATCAGKSATCTVTVTAKPVESVTLSKTAVSLVEGGSETITASVKPTNGSTQTVTWSSDNANVATVKDGKITAVKAGKAKITATCGGKSATCEVNVTAKAPDPKPVVSVSVSKTTLSLEKGKSETITASINPTDADDQTIVWASDNTAVATVKDGKIEAVKAGTAKITATCGGKSATCTVTVTEPINPNPPPAPKPVVSVSVSKTTLSLEEGSAETITASINPTDADDQTIVWASDNAAVATVKDGKITAVKEGTAKITATCGGKSATCTVTVTKANPNPDPSVTKAPTVDIDKTTDVFYSGENVVLTLTIEDEDTTDAVKVYRSIDGAEYDLTNPIDERNTAANSPYVLRDNLGDTLSVGSHTIAYKAIDSHGNESAATVSASFTITIAAQVEDIEEYKANAIADLTAYANTSKEKVDKSTATSEDKTAAKEEIEGILTNAVQRIEESDNQLAIDTQVDSAKKAMDAIVAGLVPSPGPDDAVTVTLSKTAVSLEEGKSETITATISPVSANNKTITWTSDNTAVATVKDGKITAVKAGTAKITATCGGKSATCTVTVTKTTPPADEDPLADTKKAAKDYVDGLADEAIDIIDNYSTLSDSEKEAEKKKVTDAADEAKADIDAAQTSAEIQDILNDFAKTISDILKNAISGKIDPSIIVPPVFPVIPDPDFPYGFEIDIPNFSEIIAQRLQEILDQLKIDLENAKTPEEIRAAIEKALKAIEALKKYAEALSNTITKAAEYVNKIKELIDSMPGISSSEKTELYQKIQEILQQMLDDMSKAETADEVNKIYNEAIEAIKKIYEFAQAKDNAYNTLNKYVESIKSIIKGMDDLSTTEKNEYLSKIDKILEEMLKKLEAATTEEEINKIVADAKDRINSILEEAQSVGALSESKKEANSKINSMAEEAKKKIDSLSNLTSSEKNKYKSDIEDVVTNALKDIASAKSEEEIDKVVASAKTAIDNIVNKAEYENDNISAAPELYISDIDSDTFEAGTPIKVTLKVTDGDKDEKVSVYYEIDGKKEQLVEKFTSKGKAVTVEATLPSDLSVGEHEIVFYAVDEEDNYSNEDEDIEIEDLDDYRASKDKANMITIKVVNTPAEVGIVNVPSSIKEGEDVPVNLSVKDNAGQTVKVYYQVDNAWPVAVGDYTSTGTAVPVNFTIPGLKEGTHVLTFYAEDNLGMKSNANGNVSASTLFGTSSTKAINQVTITVEPASGSSSSTGTNSAPNVDILTSKTSYDKGEDITINIAVLDKNSNQTVTSYYSVDNGGANMIKSYISAGKTDAQSFKLSNLSSGTHTITVWATDDNGSKSDEFNSITITVSNTSANSSTSTTINPNQSGTIKTGVESEATGSKGIVAAITGGVVAVAAAAAGIISKKRKK